jgi:glutamate 5-kinase
VVVFSLSGISSFSGDFEKADIVEIVDSDNRVFARGITRFSHSELSKIKGKQNKEILTDVSWEKKDQK